MGSLLTNIKRSFCEDMLAKTDGKIGFVDVGSGGPLKEPWLSIPEGKIDKFAIEPTQEGSNGKPLCLSNRIGEEKFYIAKDERGSSLHKPLESFAKRFGQESILTKRVIDVDLTTIDEMFADKKDLIDAIDVNTEGHDFQVLQGADKILSEALVKLIKVEFELTPVWDGQGWFSDIDAYLRSKGYELARIDTECSKPVNVRNIVHRGEPLWGKAYYVPSLDKWKDKLLDSNEIMKAIVLWSIADVPGRAFDLLDTAQNIESNEKKHIKKNIKKVLRSNLFEEAKTDTIRFLKMPLRFIKYYIN